MAGSEFQRPVTVAAGWPITAADENDNWDAAQDYLNERLSGGEAGEVLIGDASGNPRPTALSGDATVDANGVVAIPDVTGAKLADDVLRAYRSLFAFNGTFQGSNPVTTAPTPYVPAGETTSGWSILGNVATGTASDEVPAIFIAATDYAISGRTAKLRIRAQAQTNATSPGTLTLTFGLYPITAVAGASNTLTYTLGAAVSGSTVGIPNPPSSSITTVTGNDFDLPANGLYVVGCTTSANKAANAALAAGVQLQLHHV